MLHYFRWAFFVTFVGLVLGAWVGWRFTGTLDEHKEIHWVHAIESRVARYASVRGTEIAFVLVLVLLFGSQVEPAEKSSFLTSAIYGLLTFLVVDVLGKCLIVPMKLYHMPQKADLARSSTWSCSMPASRLTA